MKKATTVTHLSVTTVEEEKSDSLLNKVLDTGVGLTARTEMLDAVVEKSENKMKGEREEISEPICSGCKLPVRMCQLRLRRGKVFNFLNGNFELQY